MHIEAYSEKYYMDVERLVTNFYEESIKKYDMGLDKDMLHRTIIDVANNKNAFLLIVHDKCEGILAGIEVKGLLNNKRVFQEVIWYVNKSFRKYGIILFNEVQTILKKSGFDNIVMAVFENAQADKIRKLYSRLGFKPFEQHWIRGI